MSRWRYPALAFFTGAAVTIFEFAAPHLFRAYFGQTTYVWANIIGVILGALALGYAVGGRWADGTATARPLFAVLLFAGVYGIFVALAGPSIALWLAGSEEYTQDAALRAFWVQSLAASLILFGPPLVALGMATPLMVERTSHTWPVGRASGLIFGIGTVGSMCGIYLTTYVLLDSLGTRATIVGAAAALCVVGCVGFFRTGARAVALMGLLPLGAVPFSVAPPWADLPGGKLVYHIESPYQLVRVVDRPPDEDGVVQRWLAFDEGAGTYHSMALDEELWTGAYYDAFESIPEWLGREKLRICILGNAAGTMSELLHAHYSADDFEIDGVEIDPAVTKAAREKMGLDEAKHPRLRIVHADGRTFLASRPEADYDAIILDAYARQVSIPASLATKEFFALVKSRLRPGGMLFINLGALRPGGRLVHAIADTMAAGFESPVYRAPLLHQQNVVLVAARDGTVPPPPESTRLGVSLSFALHEAGDLVFTDDHCPVERFTAEDLLLR